MSELGKRIIIEGTDGTGKSEQVMRIRSRLVKAGIKVCSFVVEEPDGARDLTTGESLVPIATELRKIIKNGSLERTPWTNLSMFNDARRENWSQAIKPALERGEWVPAARSHLSTIVYQGYGEGIPVDEIEAAVRAEVGEEYMTPDLAVILDLQDEKARFERINGRGNLTNPDTFESKDESFQSRIRHGYLDYAAIRGIPVVDASGSRDEVEERIWEHVQEII